MLCVGVVYVCTCVCACVFVCVCVCVHVHVYVGVHVREYVSMCVCVSLVPRPCAFVACSTKFAQRAWARSSRDVCRSLRHVHSTGINDVIDELAPSLALKEAHRDHSNGSCANLRKC